MEKIPDKKGTLEQAEKNLVNNETNDKKEEVIRERKTIDAFERGSNNYTGEIY